MKLPPCACAYCKAPIHGEIEFSIHRDGFAEGPEVPLCEKCGGHETPSCTEIWDRISQAEPEPMQSAN